MRIKIINNRKLKRAFCNGLWYEKGIMFPWKNRKYLQIGLFGFIIVIKWGSFS